MGILENKSKTFSPNLWYQKITIVEVCMSSEKETHSLTKQLFGKIQSYAGLLILWVIVFFVTVFLVSILFENWNLKH